MSIFKKKVNQEVKKEEKELTKKEKLTNLILTIVQIVMVVVCVVISIFVILNPGGYREKPEDCNTDMMLVMTDSMEPTIMTNDLIFGEDVPNETLPLGTVVTFAVLQYKQGYYLDTHRIVGYIMTGNVEGTIGDTIYVYYVPGVVYDEDSAMAANPGYKVFKYATRGDKMTLRYCDDGKATTINQVKDYTGFKFDDETGEFILDENGNKIINNKLIDGNGYEHKDILAVVSDTRISWLGSMLRFLQDPVAFALIILLPLVLLFAYNIFLIVKMIIADRTEKARAAALAEAGAIQLDEEEIKRKAIEEYLASLKKQEENSSTEE